jgi:hypothetical protein
MVLALIASIATRRLTGNGIAAAYAAAWGETIGYAAVMVLVDYTAAARRSRGRSATTRVRDAGMVASGLLAEFGPAGMIDTFVTRPLAMAAGVRLLGSVLGVVVGKVAADVLFYAPVIYMYERRKRRSGIDVGS